MNKDSGKYTFYTIPETDLSNIENQFLLNDFDINRPIDFNSNHRLPEFEVMQYEKALAEIEVKNPADKLSLQNYLATKNRIFNDIERLTSALNSMKLPNTSKTLFVTIGNSMESYGYIMQKVFPSYNVGHIKVSRTLKDNVEKSIGKQQRIDLFYNYFNQKIGELISKFDLIETVIIIDTFAAGETMSTILHPFIKKGLKDFPTVQIFPSVLLEGGNTQPSPPYDRNLEIAHLIEVEKYLSQLEKFKKSEDENVSMPVLTFNEYFTVNQIKEGIDENNELLERFNTKKLRIFLETQKVEIKDKGEFIVIPSETTRLLSPINPYFMVAQKTVFIALDKVSKKYITRDGYGLSRKEIPPMQLHRLNNCEDFIQLTINEKINLIFEKDLSVKYKVSKDANEIVNMLNEEELQLIRSAFESFLKKKVIYHILSSFDK